MLHHSKPFLRWVTFNRPRQSIPMTYYPATSVFPLLYSNNLLAKPRRGVKEFEGVKSFDDDHPLPVVGSRSTEYATTYKLSEHDKKINPQLITHVSDLTPTPDYVGPRAGYYFPRSGWRRPGSNWKENQNFHRRPRLAEWQERHTTPRFLLAPRVSPGGPRVRYEGKLSYTVTSLSRIVRAVERGHLNPNEVITLKTLVDTGLVKTRTVMWPGVKLLVGPLNGNLPFPLHIELQSSTDGAINLIERSGGTFVATYLSPEAIHQEMYPERYPTFPEQDLPERMSMEHVSGTTRRRGFLARWAEEDAKYAHPDAGRRLSHYVRPPVERDAPATGAEMDAVKHHQKWHLFQGGSTGTVLPWQALNTFDMKRTPVGRL